MVRSVRRWLGIAAICLTILFIPVWTGALQAAQESYDPDFTFSGGQRLGAPPVPRDDDKDCIGYFASRAEAQRFFEEHGPKADGHHLDPDRDGVACEGWDYGR